MIKVMYIIIKLQKWNCLRISDLHYPKGITLHYGNEGEHYYCNYVVVIELHYDKRITLCNRIMYMIMELCYITIMQMHY